MKLYEDFYTYQKTCEIAERHDMVALKEPPSKLMARLQKLITDVMPTFFSENGELKGVYIYRASEQTEDNQNTFGITHRISEDGYIIGLAIELFEENVYALLRLVFIHECAHIDTLGGKEPHGERFQTRFNELITTYYRAHHTRIDGDSDLIPLRKIKGWKM